MNDILVEKLKIVLADTFVMYLKTQFYHWNVEGSNFIQYHDFFKDIYEELQSATDLIAENIRKLGAYAPGSLERYMQLKTVNEELNVPPSYIMISRLLETNDGVMKSLMNAYEIAEETKCIGLSNFLQDRYDIHSKYKWMMNSLLKD